MKRTFAILGGVALAAVPAVAGAQAVGGSVNSFSASEWFALVLRLGLVIGVIWAAVYAMRWYARRTGSERAGAMRALDIVETRSLGPNRSLHLVRIGGRAVLIGVTPERINALMEIDDPEVLDSLELTSDGASRPAAAFGALLAGLGAGTSKSAQALADEDGPRGASRGGLASRLLAGKRVRAERAAEKRAAKQASRAARRSMSERVLSSLGFTAVETVPQTVARLRATQSAMAPMPVPMPVRVPAPTLTSASLAPGVLAPVPRSSLFDQIEADRTKSGHIASMVAPSATQALRALSGYAAAQQSSHAGLAESMESMERDDRIAEAQRAIASARMAG